MRDVFIMFTCVCVLAISYFSLKLCENLQFIESHVAPILRLQWIAEIFRTHNFSAL